ncbi:M61 family metallopeptidase [Allochromatium palmeri]|uniref:PDZ domain-containing protein n=1 Tax=Allochromatium palmeri TaxID=231048 RepID=A0A6N8E8W5_9GAMM|nr:PDZ domain-containing protein [Allochromatium palmeri]MTW19768.1 PDZ domain-containing protein [Allochromatium palmeri]
MPPTVSPCSALIYRVRPVSPRAHLFEVELLIDPPPAGPLRLSMPAWIPGSYMIRDFARHIVAISAFDEREQPLALEKTDKQTWSLAAVARPCRIRYRVFAWDLSVRAAHLDLTHAYFNGPALLLRVQGFDACPCRLELLPPDDESCRDWRLATSLNPIKIDANGFGLYGADDYDDLIDHPVEMGRVHELTFAVSGVPHRLAITGRHWLDESRLIADLTRICAEHAALFGELQIDRYLFLVTVLGEGYGGLEHRYSTSLICVRDDLPQPGDETPTEGYKRFLGLCSHEYFHLWHVKRIRPRALMESNLEQEAPTRTLWVFEGFTAYYDELALVRAGCIEPTDYLGLLAQTLTRVARTPGRRVQTLAESSFDAWIKFYKADENAPNALVSYYAKGALVALMLDLTIRRDTQGACSLDDVMRELWRVHGRTGVGVEERGVEVVASVVTGLDLTGFFAQVLDSTAELDPTELLASVGIALRMRPSRDDKDLGGHVERLEPIEAKPKLTLGVRLRSGETLIQNVLSDGAGERAGLAPGDQLLAVEGLRVTPANLETLVARAAGRRGAPVVLHVFRRDELLTLTAHPLPAPEDTCELSLLDDVPEAVKQARAHWLSSVSAGVRHG